HLPGKLHQPLFPWLLSTETCEHIFGICRRLVKDFTMEDFKHLEPKLHLQLREAIFSARISDGKACASGYHHTYIEQTGIDIMALSTYPSNEEINAAAQHAYEEANSLFVLLGVDTSMCTLGQQTRPKLPNICSWYHVSPDESDAKDGDPLEIDEPEQGLY